MKKVLIAAILMIGLNVAGTAQTTPKKEAVKTEMSKPAQAKKATPKKHKKHKGAKKHAAAAKKQESAKK